MFFFLVIAITFCSVVTSEVTTKSYTLPPYSIPGSTNFTPPSCPVTPQEYAKVFVGTIKVFYYITTTSNKAVLSEDCLYFEFSALNANDATANITVIGRTNEYYNQYKSSVVLTINGITFQDYLNQNVDFYGTGSIDKDGVITISDCNRDLLYVGCKLDKCDSSVVSKAHQVAQKIVKSQSTPQLVSSPINFNNCTNAPGTTTDGDTW